MDARYIWSLFTNAGCFSPLVSRYLRVALSRHGQRREMAGPRGYSRSAGQFRRGLNSNAGRRDRADHSAKSHARGDADASNRCKAYRPAPSSRIPRACRLSHAGGSIALSLMLRASRLRSAWSRVEYSNEKADAEATRRWPSSITVVSSPSSIRRTGAGSGKTAGRFKACLFAAPLAKSFVAEAPP